MVIEFAEIRSQYKTVDPPAGGLLSIMFTVYVIQNEKGQTYTGQTEDLEKRLLRHNGILKSKIRSYTKIQTGPWKLIYTEECNTRVDAMKREK